tara:strand:- start:140 stop:430 length:291 start_codon:yes stop_codon:yes gene_type:complete
MNVFPVNRMILVEPITEEEAPQESTVLLPEEYKPEAYYGAGRVLHVAEDCKLDLEEDDEIIFENSMLKEVDVRGKKSYLLLENYVLCVLEGEDEIQ